jgi:hypothetical protein
VRRGQITDHREIILGRPSAPARGRRNGPDPFQADIRELSGTGGWKRPATCHVGRHDRSVLGPRDPRHPREPGTDTRIGVSLTIGEVGVARAGSRWPVGPRCTYDAVLTIFTLSSPTTHTPTPVVPCCAPSALPVPRPILIGKIIEYIGLPATEMSVAPAIVQLENDVGDSE